MTEHTELDLPEDKTLLLVDDDEPLRNRLARAMSSRGFDVIDAVGTVAEAMSIARNNSARLRGRGFASG